MISEIPCNRSEESNSAPAAARASAPLIAPGMSRNRSPSCETAAAAVTALGARNPRTPTDLPTRTVRWRRRWQHRYPHRPFAVPTLSELPPDRFSNHHTGAGRGERGSTGHVPAADWLANLNTPNATPRRLTGQRWMVRHHDLAMVASSLRRRRHARSTAKEATEPCNCRPAETAGVMPYGVR